MTVGQFLIIEMTFEATMPSGNADDAAHGAQDDGFDEELSEDVAAVRADGQANPDLAGAFRNANEHDVHDANATDDEGDASDGKEETGHDVGGGVGSVSDFLLVAHGEIVIATGTNVVTLAKEGNDLLLSGLDLILGNDLDVDVAQSGAAPATRFIALV